MGPSRGYLVQKDGSKKLRHDGVATCYEKRGKLNRKTAEGGKSVSRPTVAKITARRNNTLAEETEIGDTTGLPPTYENEAI